MRAWVAKRLPSDETLGLVLPGRVWRWMKAPEPHDFQPFTPGKVGPQQMQCAGCGAFRWSLDGAVPQESGCPRFRRWFGRTS